MADDRYEIAYREALRSITDQQTALDAIQTRVGTVASAGALATALIGLGPNREDLGGFGLLAIGCFLGILVLSGIVIWPRREWRFHFRASDLHWNYIEGARSLGPDLMKRDLALHLEAYFQANATYIDRFGYLLSTAITLLYLDVAAVLLEIWRT